MTGTLPLLLWAGISLELGGPQTLLGPGALSMNHFPDAAVALVERKPQWKLLWAAGVSTFLVQGPSLDRLHKAEKVLQPGEAGSFDNGYAGISGVLPLPGGGLFAIYHAEDHESMKKFHNGVNGYYGTVGGAISRDGGFSFSKIGPVLTSRQKKSSQGMPDQGLGEACLLRDKSGQYALMYYVDHSRRGGRGVQIFAARAPLEELAKGGKAWTKFHEGSFSQPGMGGLDSPVVSAIHWKADATFPQVTWFPKLDRYVMVFNIHDWGLVSADDPQSLGRSGTYMSLSADGIRWEEPQLLWAAMCIPFWGRSFDWHPNLIPDQEGGNRGWLVYSHSPKFGNPQEGGIFHFMMGRRFKISE